MNDSMPDPSALRRAALALHAMSDADRAWMLDALPGRQKPALVMLLSELEELGLPADADLVADLITPVSPALAGRMPAELDVAALAQRLQCEPPSIAAALMLEMQEHGSRLRGAFDAAFEARLRHVLPALDKAPAFRAAAVHAVARRVEARPTPAPSSTLERVRCWMRQWHKRGAA
jgi:hypothetical protein